MLVPFHGSTTERHVEDMAETLTDKSASQRENWRISRDHGIISSLSRNAMGTLAMSIIAFIGLCNSYESNFVQKQ